MSPLTWNQANGMRPLFAPDILKVWEYSQAVHSLDKALNLLCAAFPEIPREKLAELSIGQRDAYLLKLRELTFGSKLSCFAECSGCGEQLEFVIKTEDILLLSGFEEKEYEFEMDGIRVQYRLPSSLDLAAVGDCKDVDAACSLLTKRCVVEITYEGKSANWSDLSALTKAELAEHMAKQEPQADIMLTLNCPACTHVWQAAFDIVSYFWTEINAEARRLLYYVHVLATAYGWSEAEILAMSDTRRRFYLGMVA